MPFILGAAVLGTDALGGALEALHLSDSINQQDSDTAFLRFHQDSQLIAFPATEDLTFIQRRKIQEGAIGSSVLGVRRDVNFASYDQVRFDVLDIALESFYEDLERWWSHAKEGEEFSLGFDQDDQFLGCLVADALPGATRLDLTSTEGLVEGRKYLMRNDRLALNSTENLAPNGGFNTGVSGVTAVNSTVSQDTVTKSEGAGSCKVVTTGASGDGMYEAIAAQARYGWFTFSAMVKIGIAGRLEVSWDQDGTTVTKTYPFPADGAQFVRRSMRVLVPPRTIANLRAKVLQDTSGATTFHVDEFQFEQRQVRTPFAEPSAIVYSAATEDFEEYVTLKEVYPQTVYVQDPLKHKYFIRDVLKSRRFWPRLKMESKDNPLSRKVLTFDLTGEAREVPS